MVLKINDPVAVHGMIKLLLIVIHLIVPRKLYFFKKRTVSFDLRVLGCEKKRRVSKL